MLKFRSALITAPAYDEDSAILLGAVYERTRIVGTALRPYTGAWRHGDPVVLGDQPAPDARLEAGTYLGRFHAHFGHFILETLPALGYAAEGSGKLIFHPWPAELRADWIDARFRGFLLEALDVDTSRIHLVDRPLLVEELTVPDLDCVLIGQVGSLARDVYGRVRRYACRGGDGSAGPRRIYLSRSRFTAEPRVINENRVEEMFRRQGFDVLHPQELPMRDQVRLAAGAEVVAGVDGSAMHLCSFMRPDTRAVVLRAASESGTSHRHRRLGPGFRALNDAMDVETTELPVCAPRTEGRLEVDLDLLREHLRGFVPLDPDADARR